MLRNMKATLGIIMVIAGIVLGVGNAILLKHPTDVMSVAGSASQTANSYALPSVIPGINIPEFLGVAAGVVLIFVGLSILSSKNSGK